MAPSGRLQAVNFTHSTNTCKAEAVSGSRWQVRIFCHRISRGAKRTAFCKVGLKKPVGAGLGPALSESRRVLIARLFSTTCHPDALVAEETLFLLDKVPVLSELWGAQMWLSPPHMRPHRAPAGVADVATVLDLALSFLAGCAVEGPAWQLTQAPATNATIYVNRPYSPVGGLIQPSVT
jgi:hypothetical protein